MRLGKFIISVNRWWLGTDNMLIVQQNIFVDCKILYCCVIVDVRVKWDKKFTMKDLRMRGRGVTHWMMAISAVELLQLASQTWLEHTFVAHSVCSGRRWGFREKEKMWSCAGGKCEDVTWREGINECMWAMSQKRESNEWKKIDVMATKHFC